MEGGLLIFSAQRQTIISQFFQLDRLVVEGGKSVCLSSIAQKTLTDILYRASKEGGGMI
jgi:hypothetical protein